ncbi:DUF6397 family protein [Streptomyces candidus]|uniref:Uncharacterized protein n=1 Tax=Streptomyces candidus TaxID=67283 RepID=A0A7X0HM02_9ACTN|nr:DUF6397 family protein [Streptomyces candidus]MBB6438832.1 hypothetical protein [Streptomyces candidus]GHH52799.1 hypothetical protein GCM10018773_53400 [Streptomyces candidus]
MVVQEVQQGRGARATVHAAEMHGTVTAVRAAQELGLRRSEFDLAVQLGRIRTVADGDGGRRRVAHEELDRLRESNQRATPLKERLRTAGTAQGAALMGISRFRFTALARGGYLSPVRFHLNRYRAVVWTYLVEELTDLVARHPELLVGNYPKALRDTLDAGEDRRPRNWRSRRLGQLLNRTEDPWEQAALFSSLLPPHETAALVRGPQEAQRLAGLGAGLVAAEPSSPAAREATRRLLVADDPDEIAWIRTSLALALRDARARCPLSGPDRSSVDAGRATGLLLRLPRRAHWAVGRAKVRHWMIRVVRGNQPNRGRGEAAVPAR